MEKRIVLFDLDGTLTDPVEGITKSIVHSLERMGRDVPSMEILKKFIGPPLIPSYMEHCEMSRAEAEEAVRLYRERFSVIGWRENVPYSGIHGALEGIRADGATLALATSKPEVYAVEIMREFSLAEYFDVICGSTLDGKIIDKADVIALAADKLGVTLPRGCVMVGDTKYDMQGALTAGVTPLGVTWGYGTERELTDAGAVRLVRTVAELREAVASVYTEN